MIEIRPPKNRPETRTTPRPGILRRTGNALGIHPAAQSTATSKAAWEEALAVLPQGSK